MSELTLRERAALYVRYGLDGNGPRTLKVTGQWLGVSGVRAGQILRRVYKKLGIDGSLASVTPEMAGDHAELYRYLRWDVTDGPAGAGTAE
jgi:hypothetical protein